MVGSRRFLLRLGQRRIGPRPLSNPDPGVLLRQFPLFFRSQEGRCVARRGLGALRCEQQEGAARIGAVVLTLALRRGRLIWDSLC